MHNIKIIYTNLNQSEYTSILLIVERKNMSNNKIAPAPLYQDPLYNSPTDPVVLYNHEEKCFWMLYTQRRATAFNIGVSTIHGTKIGVASSIDGVRWLYRGTLPGLEFEPGENTFWAPEIVYKEGMYHMYVSYVRGIPTDWNWERYIVHYTASNMWEWTFESILPLSSNRVIDACVYEIESGVYKMWYKDEVHGSHTYSAISRDLYQWDVVGDEISDCAHEGPNVFELGGKKWMITDFWKGLGVYCSSDYINWIRKENILDKPGKRTMDAALAHHADVVVAGEEAFVFYFTHTNEDLVRPEQGLTASVQVARIVCKGDQLYCDRDEEFEYDMLKCLIEK